MILGYEQPVDIPMMSMYDKDMMKMYLGALQRDYEQGVADLKEYLKSIGDFYSPSSKDNENWFNMTMAPIQQFLALNPNAIRSVQGRAEIARLINSRPYEKMALLRAGAENMKEYLKNLNAMVAAGKMDAETAKLLDGDFSNYDSLGPDGVWNKTAPTALKTINEVLAPYIEDLRKGGYEDDVQLSKNGWLVKTVSDKKIKDQLGLHAADIMKDPMMQLRVVQSGLTPEDYINSQLYEHMKGELSPIRDIDKKYYEDQKLSIQKQQLAETIAARKEANAIARAKVEGKNADQHEYTDRVTFGTQTKQQLIYSQISPQLHLNYWKHQLSIAKTEKDKQRIGKWITSWTKVKDMDKTQQKLWLQKQGYVDNNGQFTLKFIDINNRVNSLANRVVGNKNGLLSSLSAKIQSENVYSGYLTPMTGADVEGSLAAIGTLNLKDKYYHGSFRSGGFGRLQYTPIRAKQFAGVRVSSRGLDYAFDSWLKTNISDARLYNTSALQAGALPGNRLEISGILSSIPYSKLEAFISKVKNANSTYRLSNGKKAKDASDKEIFDDLGLNILDNLNNEVKYSITTKDGKTTENKSWKDQAKWVLIPTSGGVNASAENLSGINNFVNKLSGGVGSAAKLIRDSQESAVEFAM